MPAWLIPTLKAVAPHIGTIISAAKPVFTNKKPEAAVSQLEVLQQQIGELQTAVANNATHVHELAEQMQKTVTALGEGAVQVNARLKALTMICVTSGILSLVALTVAVVLASR